MAKYEGWETIKTISEGGQGQIYLVKKSDMSDDKYYVLKALKNKNRIDRFKEEIKAGLELEHPNIIKVIEYDYETKHPFMITEFYKNGALKDFEMNKLTFEEKLQFFKKILEALVHAHENHVTHRDLKPDNIFLTDNLEPVIGDFGLCLFEDGERVTVTDEAIGSRYYMAPENANGRFDDVNYAGDVYSLGKIFYYILTGKIFDREVHRSEKFDITQEKPFREFYLINEYLDKMIVEYPEKRFPNVITTLNEYEILLRRIETGTNCIGYDIPQNCIYCGLGHYKPIRNKIEFGQTVIGDVFKFIDDGEWIFFQCDHCMNIQLFRPIMKGSKNRWVKNKEK